jgi:hypothetical protein
MTVIKTRFFPEVPFKVEKTWSTYFGHVEIIKIGGGYQWRYTELNLFVCSGAANYSSVNEASEAVGKYLAGELYYMQQTNPLSSPS